MAHHVLQTQTRQLITVPECAARLGVTTKTVRRYIAAGRLTAVRIGPRLIRLDAREVDNFGRPVSAAGW